MDDGYLHIVSVTEKNSGRYVCFSRNPVTGTVRSGYATNLAVEGKFLLFASYYFWSCKKKIFPRVSETWFYYWVNGLETVEDAKKLAL